MRFFHLDPMICNATSYGFISAIRCLVFIPCLKNLSGCINVSKIVSGCINVFRTVGVYQCPQYSIWVYQWLPVPCLGVSKHANTTPTMALATQVFTTRAKNLIKIKISVSRTVSECISASRTGCLGESMSPVPSLLPYLCVSMPSLSNVPGCINSGLYIGVSMDPGVSISSGLCLGVSICPGLYLGESMSLVPYMCVSKYLGVSMPSGLYIGVSMYPGLVYRYLQDCVWVYRCLQYCIWVYQCLQDCIWVYQCLQDCAWVYQCAQYCVRVYQCLGIFVLSTTPQFTPAGYLQGTWL